MFLKRFFLKRCLLLSLVVLTCCLTIANAIKTNEISEADLERMAFNFMSMIEFKLKKGGKVNELEIRLMTLLMNEIEKRIEMEREREANTVYWHLRQG